MNKNSGIQALRALAAICVLFQHSIVFSCLSFGTSYAKYLPADFGRIGVYVFFVISGYVVTNCMGQGKSFILKRALRIYPPFWIAIVISFLFREYAPVSWHATLGASFLVSWSDYNNSLNIPYWTLLYEVVFYLIIYAAILTDMKRDHFRSCLVGWLALVSAVNLYHNVDVVTPGWWIFLSRQNVFFIFGALYALSEDEVRISTPYLAVIALVSWGIGFNLPDDHLANVYASAICFTSALAFMSRIRMPIVMSKLGDASYGLYLVHSLCIAASIEVLRRKFPTISLHALMASVFSIGLVCGSLFGVVEFRLHKYLNRLLRPGRRPATV